MKTNTSITANSTRFAFMPEMVLNHLNEAKPTEITVKHTASTEVKKIIITADPEIPNLDSLPIPEMAAKKESKAGKKGKKAAPETPPAPTEENVITRFINKIKIY